MKKKRYNAEKIRDLRTLVGRAADLYSTRIAYKELSSKKDVLEYSFNQLEEDVNSLGTALIDHKLEGKHIALIGENSYLWVVSYLSVINGVGVIIPLDKELPDEDIAKLLNKCDADAVICSDSYVSTIEAVLPICPKVKTTIVMYPRQEYAGFLSINQLISEGTKLLEEGNRDYLGAPIDVNAMAEIIFTSGTTGANKGVMLSQKNIMSVIYGAFHLIKPGAVSLSVLPLNHAYECSCHILGGIYCGLTVCFNDSLRNISKNLKRFKPNFTIMVPLFIESMDKTIWKKAAETGLVNYFKWGVKFSDFIRKFNIDRRKKYFKPVIEAFGGNLEQIVCGGAPLRNDLINSFESLGINIVNGYGISECAPLVAANCSAWKRVGSVGVVIPGCQVRIMNKDQNGNGEIQVKGNNVMLGYYKDEVATNASFTEDGWFITGDLGHLDKEGFLYLTGRNKNLIILPNGKNVYPEEIEDIITFNLSYVKEVVVTASMSKEEGSNAIQAYVCFDPESIKEEGFDVLRARIKTDIKKINRRLASYKHINTVYVGEKEFEKTTTKKIKRTIINKEDFKIA